MANELGPRLTDEAELLLRHATDPGWIVDGRPTSQLFELRPIDKGLLSVERLTKHASAATALAHFNDAFAPRQSVSVWGVSVGEVNALGIAAYESPSKKLPAHASIDLRSLNTEVQQVAAVRLTEASIRRGQQAPQIATIPTAQSAPLPVAKGALPRKAHAERRARSRR